MSTQFTCSTYLYIESALHYTETHYKKYIYSIDWYIVVKVKNFAVPFRIVFSADDNEQGFDFLFLATTTQG